jgi:hypothetical protein
MRLINLTFSLSLVSTAAGSRGRNILPGKVTVLKSENDWLLSMKETSGTRSVESLDDFVGDNMTMLRSDFCV